VLPRIRLRLLWHRILLLGREILIDKKLSHDEISKIQTEDMNWSDGIQISQYNG
jgi:hypothetical protein